MNYEKIYKNLYKKAKNRGKVKISRNMEFHHFVPKSLYYSKYKSKIMKILDINFNNNEDGINIYPLTLKEHYNTQYIGMFPKIINYQNKHIQDLNNKNYQIFQMSNFV